MSNKEDEKIEEPKKRILAETVTCAKIAKSLYDLIKMILKRKRDKDQKEADKITDDLIENYNEIDKNSESQKEKEDIDNVKDDLNSIF